MLPAKASEGLSGSRRVPLSERLGPITGHVAVFGGVLALSHMLLQRIGFNLFLVALVLVFAMSIYAYLSSRSLVIPFSVWILSIGGFRFLWAIQTPMLPDMTLDRLAMVWLTAVFLVKFFAERRSLRKPLVLDTVLLIHALYIVVRIYINDRMYFHIWTMSYLVPYSVFFFAKNIVYTRQRIRLVLAWLLCICAYYSITSVAEQYNITWLVWPKWILQNSSPWVGRSNGPFEHAPLFGTVIGMMLPIHLYFIATTERKWVRFLVFAGLAIGFAGLFFTYTRGAWLVGIVAFGTAVLLNWRRYMRIVAPAAVILPIMAVAMIGSQQGQFFRQRIESDNTIEARLGVAATALRVWRDNPFFGAGFFMYRHVREDYIQALEVPFVGNIKFAYYRHNSIHDIYLGPLAEDGIIGAFLQAFIYLLILRAWLTKFVLRKSGDEVATYVLPVFAGMFLGYLVGGLAIDYRFFSVVGTLFYVAAGIIEGYRPEEGEERRSVPNGTA